MARTVEPRNIAAKADSATRCWSDDICKDTVLVGLEIRFLTMVMGPIAVFANAVDQTFVCFPEQAAAYFSIAVRTTKRYHNGSAMFVEL